jgi:hypothetical protein
LPSPGSELVTSSVRLDAKLRRQHQVRAHAVQQLDELRRSAVAEQQGRLPVLLEADLRRDAQHADLEVPPHVVRRPQTGVEDLQEEHEPERQARAPEEGQEQIALLPRQDWLLGDGGLVDDPRVQRREVPRERDLARALQEVVERQAIAGGFALERGVFDGLDVQALHLGLLSLEGAPQRALARPRRLVIVAGRRRELRGLCLQLRPGRSPRLPSAG